MGWLGRITGKDPPKVPAGGRAFASMDAPDASAWSVRVQMLGEDRSSRCKQIGPSFARQTTAYAYLAWIEGGPKFRYPEGRA